MRPFVLGLLFSLAVPVAARAQQAQRSAAIARAFNFLQAVAANDKNVAAFGGDLLVCFDEIAHTARDRGLRRAAARTGRDLARRWRKLHPHVPPDATAAQVYLLTEGAYAADRLGVRDPRFKVELRRAAHRFTATDFFGFDAPRAPPPMSDPNRYDLWLGALIISSTGGAYGVGLGAPYRDVLKWRPCMRPYGGHGDDMDFDSFYAVTHIIYTLNGYNQRRISPALLPEEFAYIRHELAGALDDEDPEKIAEALDTLRAAGFERDADVRYAMDDLVSLQRDDGTWAGDADDLYTQYHSAWAGLDGLRDYRFRGTVRKLPRTDAVHCP